MIVAVLTVRVMQVAVDEVVDVIAVRDRLVSTVGAVHVGRIVTRALVAGGAVRRVRSVDVDLVLVDVILVGVVEVTVVQVVDVVSVLHRGMTAARVVLVVVVLVLVAAHSILRFTGVFDHALDQLGDVVVGEQIKLMFAFASASEESLATEDTQPSRNGRQRIARESGEFRHTTLSARQQLEEPQAARIPRSAEDGRGSLQHFRGAAHWRGRDVVVIAGRFVGHLIEQSNTRATVCQS